MKATMAKKRTITFRRITADDLKYFHLESPGYDLAKAAVKAGKLFGPIGMIETVCAANKLYEAAVCRRIADALVQHGKPAEYRNTYKTYQALALIIETLGRSRLLQIFCEAKDELYRKFEIPADPQ